MSKRRSLTVALGVLVIAGLSCTACGPTERPGNASGTNTALTTARPTGATASASGSSTAPVPSNYPLNPGPGPQAPPSQAPQPTASWTAAAEGDALAAAAKAMGFFAHPESGEPKWFEDLKPYLTPDAAESFSYTDPANVTVHKVLGKGALKKDAGNPFGAFIEFATDAGTYSVQVVRVGDAAPWQVAAIAPAESK